MTLTPDEVRPFIRSHQRGVLATMRRDGGPQLSPVLVGVDDDGSLIISTREPARKTANVRRAGDYRAAMQRDNASCCAFKSIASVH